MLKVTVELIQHGVGPGEVVVEGIIFNDTTGTEKLGNYGSRFATTLKPTDDNNEQTTKMICSGSVVGFDRLNKNALELVSQAIINALANQPHRVVSSLPYKVVNGELVAAKDDSWFVVVKDDSGHDYVIPASKKSEWYVSLEESAYGRFEAPKWADRIDGTFKFKEYKHGR